MPGGRKKKSTSAKKGKSRRPNGEARPPKPTKPVPLEEVLGRADTAMEMSDVDSALQLFTYAAGVLKSRMEAGSAVASEASPADAATLATVLGKMGELKAATGDVDGARSDFLDAIDALGPSATHDGEASSMNEGGSAEEAQKCESRAGLHLYLGQLSSGTEALEAFRTGVAELETAVDMLERVRVAAGEEVGDAAMEGEEEETDAARLERFLVETRRQLCAAHCSIAELYLTDLCEEPAAEACCEAALTSALAVDAAASVDASIASTPDALQTMANFRLSQSRVPEALDCILKAYERMRVGCEAMAALVGLGHDDGEGKGEGAAVEASKAWELVEVDAASSLPEYSFRIQTAKILLECASLGDDDDGAKHKCAEAAVQVLGSLLAENDEVIEAWYLLGCAFSSCAPPDVDAANYYWENALEMLTKVKKGLEETMGEGDDEEDECRENELEATECQIIEVRKKLGRCKDEEVEEDGEEMDDS